MFTPPNETLKDNNRGTSNGPPPMGGFLGDPMRGAPRNVDPAAGRPADSKATDKPPRAIG